MAEPETIAFWYFVFNWKLKLNSIQSYKSRPKPICKGDVECRFFEFGVEMAKWPWGSRSFSMPAERIPKCILGSNLVLLAKNPLQVILRTSLMPKLLGQKGQNDLEGQGQWHPFSILGENILRCLWLGHETMVCAVCLSIFLCIFWCKFDTSSNLWRVSRGKGEVYMHRRIDGQTQATPKPHWPEGPRSNWPIIAPFLS